MSGRQLAQRVGVTRQRASIIEKQEIAGTATLKTMRNYAEALDCAFVYGFVPNSTLEQTVRNRASEVAKKRLARVSQTMALEGQALSSQEDTSILSEMIDELVHAQPSDFWDE